MLISCGIFRPLRTNKDFFVFDGSKHEFATFFEFANFSLSCEGRFRLSLTTTHNVGDSFVYGSPLHTLRWIGYMTY